MKSTAATIVTFFTAGCLAGLCSGLSVIVRPLGLILPGVLFGVAIAYAVNASLVPLSARKRAAIIGVSTLAYLIAIVTSILSLWLPGFDYGIISGLLSGAIAGGVGAFMVSVSLTFITQEFRPVPTIIVVSLAGVALGSLFEAVGVYISDHTSAGHPFDDIVAFPLWQTGVASVIPLFRHRLL